MRHNKESLTFVSCLRFRVQCDELTKKQEKDVQHTRHRYPTRKVVGLLSKPQLHDINSPHSRATAPRSTFYEI